MVTNFQIFLQLLQDLPPHLNYVATLPCKLKWRLNVYSYHQN